MLPPSAFLNIFNYFSIPDILLKLRYSRQKINAIVWREHHLLSLSAAIWHSIHHVFPSVETLAPIMPIVGQMGQTISIGYYSLRGCGCLPARSEHGPPLRISVIFLWFTVLGWEKRLT